MLSDQLLLETFKDHQVPTAVYDSPELHISFVNAAMLQLWGKDEYMVGKTLSEALLETNRLPVEDVLKMVWQTGESLQATELPFKLSKGDEDQLMYFNSDYRVTKNDSGDTIALLHTMTDITEKVRERQNEAERQSREEDLLGELSAINLSVQAANQHLHEVNEDLQASNENISRLNVQLLESQTDFKRLVEQAPVAILVFRGPELVIELANPPILEILHKDAGIIGKPILESMPELKGEPAVELIFEVVRTGKGFDGNEVPVQMMNNGISETRYFNFSYRPLTDNGKIVGVMDIAVEVTDQVLSRQRLEAILAEKTILEQTLRTNEQRLQTILDTMAEGVVIVDSKGKPTYANSMAQKIMHMEESQFREYDYEKVAWWTERIDGSPLEEHDHPMFVVLRTGLAVYDQEMAIVFNNREKIYVTLNAAPVINDQNEVTGCIVTFSDITNRVKLRMEKDDFISVASHELKTPVTSLKASLQLLHRNLPDDGSSNSKLIRQANKSLEKLSDLVNRLLNTNKVSEGRFALHKTSFKIADLVSDCCQHIRTAGTHTVVFEGNLQLKLEADEQLIDQVIVNLVNNAVKYAPASNEIIIRITEDDNFAKISVEDSGPGIAPEKVPHIFERYYRADSNQLQVSGIGLGLYICAGIIQKHGGEIGVESVLGQGSTFWFTLPL